MICVDASVAAKWVLSEDDSDLADQIYITFHEGGIIAPPFLPVEVTNAIWKHVVRGPLTVAEAQEALAKFLEFELEISERSGLHRLALDLTYRFSLRAVYDMHYVALAQLAGCDLWTADRRLLNAVSGRLPFVRDLAEVRG